MLPAITDASKMFPELVVDWVIEEAFQAVPAWHPAVEDVLPVAIRRWRKNIFSLKTVHEIRSTRKAIRSSTYDAIIDSQGLFKSSVITHWARGTHFGYDHHSAREPLSSWAYDQRLSVSRNQHAIDRNRQITAKALGYDSQSLTLDYGIKVPVDYSSIGVNLPHTYIIALHGTSRPDKEWPEQNWIELAHRMTAQTTPLVLPWGSQREHERAKRIAENSTAIVLPKLDLDSLACIINKSTAVVGMDTGLMHIAAALGKPGVAIYPVTKPELTGVISGKAEPAIVNLEGTVTTEEVIQTLYPQSLETSYRCL